MENTADVDLLIIGQGLAGSAVAMQALSRNYRIRVIDDLNENRSSRVAAGLFNPVTGRKMAKTWLADDLFPFLRRYYEAVERLTGNRFFYPLPIYRPFVSVEEQNEWMGKSADTSYHNYIHRVTTSCTFGDKVKDPFGGITLKQSGYLDTGSYLDSVRTYLESRQAFERSIFEADKLEVEETFVRYGNLKAKKIVFCQGVRNSSNPWFKFLPINSLKGELFTIQSEWKKDVILNRGVYMVPGYGLNEWRVGATYDWSDVQPGVTARAQEELTVKLKDLIRIPFTITDQQWGVRPTTPDRKPIVGAHAVYRCLIIFNGLGTKGVSLAPYFSEVLCRWLENKGAINKEADLTRFN